ncbi:MAG: hypothetical protein DDT19_02243 [Syntrophomonadaceae bacterium]|nr:hypothetical protein [Bacillota bacterium]
MRRASLKQFKKIINEILNEKETTHSLKRALYKIIKEIKLYENYLERKKKWKNLSVKIDPKKIQIGGGTHILKDFVNIDIIPPANLICDVREGLPFEDQCSEFIFCEHFLEHIDYPVSVKKFISECYRVLKLNGQLVIGVPDSEMVIKSYYKKDLKFYKKILQTWYSKRNFLPYLNTYIDLVNYHFRDQNDDEKYTPHLWAYDYEKLKSLLKETGFSKVKKWKFDPSIGNPERKFGTLYMVAIK